MLAWPTQIVLLVEQGHEKQFQQHIGLQNVRHQYGVEACSSEQRAIV